MGLITAKISLANSRIPTLAPIEVKAMADSGAMLLCIPRHVALQLQLDEIDQREVITSDGKLHVCPYVGPIHVTFKNRGCFTGALVLGDEVLLGAVPMEDMDLVLSPARQTIDVNPESPNIPMAIVKKIGL